MSATRKALEAGRRMRDKRDAVLLRFEHVGLNIWPVRRLVAALERAAIRAGIERERGRQAKSHDTCAACPDTPDNSQGYCAQHGTEMRDRLDELDPPFARPRRPTPPAKKGR